MNPILYLFLKAKAAAQGERRTWGDVLAGVGVVTTMIVGVVTVLALIGVI